MQSQGWCIVSVADVLLTALLTTALNSTKTVEVANWSTVFFPVVCLASYEWSAFLICSPQCLWDCVIQLQLYLSLPLRTQLPVAVFLCCCYRLVWLITVQLLAFSWCFVCGWICFVPIQRCRVCHLSERAVAKETVSVFLTFAYVQGRFTNRVPQVLVSHVFL